MKNFLINGGKKLSGSVAIGGSKNASLPIIAATLLSKEKSVLKNVPDIADIHKMIEILNHIGVKTEFSDNTLTIDPSEFEYQELPKELVCHMRASILLAGPMLARFKEVDMGFPGGCVLGKRSVESHVRGLSQLGAKLVENHSKIHMKADKLTGGKIVLPEFSVTGTENVITAAVMAEGDSEIHIAAAEPHVADLCHMLNGMGAKIEGIGSHTLKIQGVTELKGAEHSIVPDYLEAGTFILAGAITNSPIEVTNFNPDDLHLFLEKLTELGVKLEIKEHSCKIIDASNLKAISEVKTAVHPGFPTDLLAPFTVLLTQAEGVSKIFETLFNGRFNFLYELEKMGVKQELLNAHQAIVIGKAELKGSTVASCDIRAGAAMVLAALAAHGETLITDIRYIDRGYENLDKKLQSLGAEIKRVDINEG